MTEETPKSSSFFRLAGAIFRLDPGRMATVVLLLLVSGIAEGIGLMTLLPLLGSATGRSSDDQLTRLMTDVLSSVGLHPTLGTLLAIVVIGLSLKAGLFLLAMLESGYAAADVGKRLRLEFVTALTEARWGYFTSQPLGRLTNAIGTEGTRATLLYTEMAYLLAAVFQAMVYLVLAIFTSLYVTLGAILFGGLMFVGFSFLVRISRAAGARETDLYQSMTARLADGLIAIKPLKAMGKAHILRPVLESDLDELNQAWRRQTISKASLNALQEPLMAVFIAVGFFIAVRRAGVPLEQLLFMALLFQRIVTRLGNAHVFYQSVMTLETAFWSLVGATRQAERAREINTGTAEPTLAEGIVLDGVTFSYGSKTVLDDFTLRIPAGRLTTLVGGSGAGKTTVLDIVLGLFVPDKGRVLVDGRPLNEIDIARWRNDIGYVPQDLVLLHDTIFSNITLGDPNITKEDAFKALASAGAMVFIAELPEGLDTVVGERGARLSGGQRQRIAIARALVRGPRLVILDEATSALDPATAAEISDSLVALKGDLTILAVTHQKDLVEAADQVVTIESVDGRHDVPPTPTSI
jgi:ATP-binding cassette subfamily C protein